MEDLVAFYADRIQKIKEGSIFEIFSTFYTDDIGFIHAWLEEQFKQRVTKNEKKSLEYKTTGNDYFLKKEWTKCLEFYTKSICFATVNSEQYGVGLANRSAVSFATKDYLNCLKDIELCFKSKYPARLRPKIYLRKAECFYHLNDKKSLRRCIAEVTNFLQSAEVKDKERYMAKLGDIRQMKMIADCDVFVESPNEIPCFPDGENENFAYASPKIKMSYSKSKGRHVIAKTNIQRGELLFIEKAFVFASVFKDNRELHTLKCYNCLKNLTSSVPCEFCTVCVFCDEGCRKSSWRIFHKWECKGMQSSIWYDLGIAFPAFRAMLRGVHCGDEKLSGDYREDLKRFGDKENNYRYLNRLLSHIYKNKNMAPYIVVSTL